jgi:NhaP-type Na+/H+ or K+/H+ antiporter
MLEIFSLLLALILLSKFIEDRVNIPFVLVVIALSYMSTHIVDLSLLRDNFENIVYMMLPIILIPDVLGLSRSELKENVGSIFYLSVVAVFLSIAAAVTFTYFYVNPYEFSLFHLLIIFTPLMATDVVSVSAIFTKFKLPEKMKLYAEGESLFNDITAMVIFFFIALPFVSGEEISLLSLTQTTLYVVALSVLIGFIVGLMGYLSFKHARDNFERFIAIYLMASLSFLVSEKLELSAILGVVVSVMFFKYLFDKEGHYKTKNYAAILKKFTPSSKNSNESIRAYKKEAQYLGLFANAILFISIANVIDLELLLAYKFEILYVFMLTTLIRYGVMTLFVLYKKYPLHWSNILSFSGMKGGLALIMVVSLSNSFAYKEMFLAITLGVVILSIFIYTFVLMLYLSINKELLLVDKAHEHNMYIEDIKELLEKDEKSGAYNEIVFEDIVEKEIYRAQRYSQSFSLVAFKADEKTLKKMRMKLLRRSDYLGKLNSDYYAVLLTHTSLDEAFLFSEKLEKKMPIRHVTIAQYIEGDTKEILYEKLSSGLGKRKSIDVEL